MRAAAIYSRISRDRTGEGVNSRRHAEECQRWADEHGITVAEVYVDNDISAYRGKARPAYERMWLDIKEGRRDGIIVFAVDRLHRQPRELEDLIDFLEATKVKVQSLTGGLYDLSKSDGRAMARVVGVFARKESEDKSDRIKSQKREQAKEGRRSGGGTRGYGYNGVVKDETGRIIKHGHTELVPSEAAVIRDAAKRVLAGETLNGICVDLNERGVTTVMGGQWSTTVLRRILTTGATSGQVEHLGEMVGKGKWPAILTPDQTTRLRAKLLDPARRTNRSPRRYPLTGLVACGLCGAKMVARPRGDGARRYYCAKGPGFKGCGSMAILSEPLEAFITEAVLYRLDTPELQQALHGKVNSEDEFAALQAEIDSAQGQLDELAAAYGNHEVPLREWLIARKPLDARMEDATRHMAYLSGSSALEGFVGDSDALRTQWPDLSPARQRAILASVMDHLTISPAVKGRTKFDPSRIAVVWSV